MTDRVGERLVKYGLITNAQLEEAISLQQRDGGLIGDVLVKYGFITESELSNFIFKNKYSRLGEILIQKGLINQDQLKIALDYQKKHGGRIGNICVNLGYISKEVLDSIFSDNTQKKGKIGDILLEKGIITKEQIENAIEVQNKSGGRIGDILVYLEYIDSTVLYKELSMQMELGRPGDEINVDSIKNIPYVMAKRYNAIVLSEREDCFLVGVKDILGKKDIMKIEGYLKKSIEQVLITDEEMNRYWETKFKNLQKHKSVFDLYETQPENSAIVTFSTGQLVVLIIIVILLVFGFVMDWQGTLFGLNLFFQVIYALMTILKLYIVIKGEHNNIQLRFTPNEIDSIDEKDLPVYTILIPVYKEKEVIKKLIKNINDFDYPKYKLDVRILLEEDDVETIDVVRSMKLPNFYTVLIVPSSKPQTKPKACNYGLLQAKGEYVVIFDAEDRPERDQLKKAYLAFKNLPEKYVCVQAKLNYFNSRQNVLTKLFTQEYSMWFENLLVGIMQLDIPVPLGGTSNHFKLSFLKEVGGWDPFNVTEDADLGVRLFKFKYKTAVLDSRTWEEANSNVGNWIRQRSRWIKGYMQTWLVHMRHPRELYKNLGIKGFIGYQAMVLGTPLLPIINPIFWGLMILWYATKAYWIQDLFPGAFYYIAAIQLIIGNFMFMYTNIIGMYSVIRDCALKKQQFFSYSLIKHALFTPYYWFLMSVAAYKALFQLIKNPFYWEKTHHGLSTSEDLNDEVLVTNDTNVSA